MNKKIRKEYRRLYSWKECYYGKRHCRCIKGICSCNKGIYYTCGNNLAYAEKADISGMK
ncbi:MAG: hypothetical protein KKE23_01960 [Nanoarchaeota archaeon]|nr:hypothetical protein [Nanoarchaeota archaeon]